MEEDPLSKHHEQNVMIEKADKTFYLGKVMRVLEDKITIKVDSKLKNPTYYDIIDAIQKKDLYSKDEIENIAREDMVSISSIDEIIGKNF